MFLIEHSLQNGEAQLSKVLGLGYIGIDFQSPLDLSTENLMSFRLSLAAKFNPTESKEIFAIVVSVAGRTSELLQFIDSTDIQGFIDKIHQIVAETRGKETAFYATKDGRSTREFRLSSKAPLYLRTYPDGKYSVSGTR